ncbi:helix-turn-helix domain-containing protein [Helicovermis profundi]|uniref:Helix-turn-helix transcriptional regulator n=1 Tax=Helicovermis profundi TaxID=3065157 RepID=A0AAU9E0Y1_9FIRM|nr:helix-turn-helix transcriptional regulator [Clostridia bacterium S502]
MILADKIVNLRKKSGWSQEELAFKMNVSRQSISKWESARSIPDLNKILLLSNIFGVTTDYLVKDEIEDITEVVEDNDLVLKRLSLEEITDFLERKVEYSKYVSKGAFIIISSVTPLLFLLALSDQYNFSSSTAAAFGLILLMSILIYGIIQLIKVNNYNDDFNKFKLNRFELDYGVSGIIREKMKEFKPIYTRRLSISIILFLTSFLPLITISILTNSGNLALYMVIVLILMIAIGVYNIIPVSDYYKALNFILGEGDYAPHKRKEVKKTEQLASFYWPLVVAVYLAWSLWTMDWGITWIVWPVAAVGFAALIGLVGLFDKKNIDF